MNTFHLDVMLVFSVFHVLMTYLRDVFICFIWYICIYIYMCVCVYL